MPWGTLLESQASLLTLYFILISIKISGASIGWGFQLQSPIMIQSLILLFTLIMCINLDLIQIPLPSFASRKSNNMILSGVLTTLIATPCTAPFLGSALSIALLQSPFIGSLIFLSMSIGLALPMVCIIIVPYFRKLIPKSGQWNQSFKYYLNIGFVVTIGWFMWILSAQISTSATLAFFSSIITLFCLFIFRSKTGLLKPLIILILTICVGLPSILMTSNNSNDWAAYSNGYIEELEYNNQPYFIDITAKWCITCQTNKLTVLNTTEGKALFKSQSIQRVQADWTNKNDDVSNLLAKYNKVSIPTYIYFDGQSHKITGDILTLRKLKTFLSQPE